MAKDFEQAMPIGEDFLHMIRQQEEQCEAKYKQWLRSAGDKAPQIPESLGTALVYLDCLGSCYWACRGGNHLEERLLGRACSNAKAAFRLLGMGFYDEALGIIRQIGETANLLSMFSLSGQLRDQWENSTEKARRNKFSAGNVRRLISDYSGIVVMDEQTYTRLSLLSIHITPETSPQNHNIMELPSFANLFQEVGTLASLNHLADMVGWTLFFGSLLIRPPVDQSIFRECCADLMTLVGRVKVTTIPELWNDLREGNASGS